MTARPRPASAVEHDAGGASHGNGVAPVLVWEDWVQRATPAQRAAAIALAQQQGVLLFQQLPPAHGLRPSAPAQSLRSALPGVLAGILAGRAGTLPDFSEEPLTDVDSELDDVQCLAVARALQTPDVCLIQGYPGTGKSRVVAEIVTQAARRGWRTLLVADAPAPLDVVLHWLVGRAEVMPVRFLEPGENDLPAWLRGFTLVEQQQAFLARTLAGARQSASETESRLQQGRQGAACWEPLARLVDDACRVTQRLEVIAEQLGQVEDVVHRQSALGEGEEAFLIELRRQAQAQDERLAALDREQIACVEQQAAHLRAAEELAHQLEELQPKLEATRQGRWWTAGYWSAGGVRREVEALQERLTQANEERAEADRQLQQLAQRRREAEEAFRVERDDIIRAEIARRRQELLAEQRELEHDLVEIDARALEVMQPLPVTLRPALLSVQALAEARTRWQQKIAGCEAEHEFAGAWVDHLENAGQDLAARLPGLANVLVGTLPALRQDAAFRAALEPECELLIVEEADRLTESELLDLARHARRLVLVGAAAVAEETAGDNGRPDGAMVALHSTCWARLVRALDTPAFGYSWRSEDERLICQLVPLSADDRGHLVIEPLADASDVELRILDRPHATPLLAELAFPARFTFVEAFDLVVRELQEVPVQPLRRMGCWQSSGRGWTWQVASGFAAPSLHHEPAPGVRVGFWEGPDGVCRVANIMFDASWDRTRAEEWLNSKRGAADRRRSVVLQVPYRYTSPLAASVADVLFAGNAFCLPSPEMGAGAGMEFESVPPARKLDLPREGAGLELELASNRHADRMPSELRAQLPSSGFANYLEAQAVVRRLEELVQTRGLPPGRRDRIELAVLALYEGQAELIRHLVARSELLREKAGNMVIAVPAAVRQREFDVVLVSLTRSHAHRSVPFGDDPADLLVALTRARRDLYLFGDPGTLVKRTLWQGPLDHLPAGLAEVEKARLTRLLRHVKQTRAAPEPTLCLAGKD